MRHLSMILIALFFAGTFTAHATIDENIRIVKNEFFEAAEAYLSSHEPWKSSDVSISRKYVKELEVPADAELQIEVEKFSCSKPWGKLAIPVTIIQNGAIKRRIQTYLNVDMRTTVAVAVRNIRHQEQFTTKNVKFIKMPLSGAPRTAVIHKNAIQNSRAIGAVMAGKIITTRLVEAIPDIKKGQKISLVATRNGITVAAAGTAREDGYAGERIRVINEKSKKILVGIVCKGGVVEIANF